MGIVIVLVGQLIQYPLSDELIAINQCGDTSNLNDTSVLNCFQPSHNNSVPPTIKKATDLYNSSHTIFFCLALMLANFFILVICFRPRYRRMESEKRSSFEKSTRVK